MDKMCTKCREVKPLDDYYRKASSSDGHQSFCKKCHGEYNHKYQNRRYRQMPKNDHWRQVHTQIPVAVHAQVLLAAKMNRRSLGYEITELLRLGLAAREQQNARRV